ncbi:hypothetical protein [Chryseobacterium sp. GP-SGM7]|uniref:hypothetical protein n=1 Tax=Chryseobacterium sp. GP-SGM7 TaxID=3411323 RepID=UPI003B92E512
MNKIDERDYNTQRVKLVDENINIYEDTFSTYENNFVTKLNEKYAVLLELGKIDEPRELIHQFQIPKKYAYSSMGEDSIRNSFEKISNIPDDKVDEFKEFYLIPDFIIHQDQKDKSAANQRLIAEVKTENNLSYKKFAYDFLKLIIYLNKFNFQNAIFLSVNMEANIIEEYLQRYFSERMYLPENYNKLHIILKENYEKEPNVFSLQEFFDKNIRNTF